jgi:hypothetical protein
VSGVREAERRRVVEWVMRRSWSLSKKIRIPDGEDPDTYRLHSEEFSTMLARLGGGSLIVRTPCCNSLRFELLIRDDGKTMSSRCAECLKLAGEFALATRVPR